MNVDNIDNYFEGLSNLEELVFRFSTTNSDHFSDDTMEMTVLLQGQQVSERRCKGVVFDGLNPTKVLINEATISTPVIFIKDSFKRNEGFIGCCNRIMEKEDNIILNMLNFLSSENYNNLYKINDTTNMEEHMRKFSSENSRYNSRQFILCANSNHNKKLFDKYGGYVPIHPRIQQICKGCRKKPYYKEFYLKKLDSIQDESIYIFMDLCLFSLKMNSILKELPNDKISVTRRFSLFALPYFEREVH